MRRERATESERGETRMRMGTDEDEDTTEDVCDEIEGVCGRIIDTCEVRSGDRTTKGPEDKRTIGQ